MATMNLKALAEQRAALLAEMEAISETAHAETRAYSEEELARADELEAQIRAIDATYKAEEARAVLAASPKAVPVDGEVVPSDKTEAEERAFAQYIVDSKAEFRSGELTMSANGAVIPTSIVNKIISKVKEISPLYAVLLIPQALRQKRQMAHR